MTYGQIKDKMIVGDYELAARMLETSRENVRQRLVRRKEDVLSAFQVIIENRERLINSYKSKNK